jgi:hypothetical protein
LAGQAQQRALPFHAAPRLLAEIKIWLSILAAWTRRRELLYHTAVLPNYYDEWIQVHGVDHLLPRR